MCVSVMLLNSEWETRTHTQTQNTLYEMIKMQKCDIDELSSNTHRNTSSLILSAMNVIVQLTTRSSKLQYFFIKIYSRTASIIQWIELLLIEFYRYFKYCNKKYYATSSSRIYYRAESKNVTLSRKLFLILQQHNRYDG